MRVTTSIIVLAALLALAGTARGEPRPTVRAAAPIREGKLEIVFRNRVPEWGPRPEEDWQKNIAENLGQLIEYYYPFLETKGRSRPREGPIEPTEPGNSLLIVDLEKTGTENTGDTVLTLEFRFEDTVDAPRAFSGGWPTVPRITVLTASQEPRDVNIPKRDDTYTWRLDKGKDWNIRNAILGSVEEYIQSGADHNKLLTSVVARIPFSFDAAVFDRVRKRPGAEPELFVEVLGNDRFSRVQKDTGVAVGWRFKEFESEFFWHSGRVFREDSIKSAVGAGGWFEDIVASDPEDSDDATTLAETLEWLGLSEAAMPLTVRVSGQPSPGQELNVSALRAIVTTPSYRINPPTKDLQRSPTEGAVAAANRATPEEGG